MDSQVEPRDIVSSGAPLDDTRAYRYCLAQYGTGITVITTLVDGTAYGLTSNSFTSVSLDPPLILFSVDRKSRSYAAFRKASHYAVNVLGHDQLAIAQTMASKAEDKFAAVLHSAGLGGAPLIEGAIVSLECEAYSMQEAGDHILCIGRVVRYIHARGNGLLYVQGSYGQFAGMPGNGELANTDNGAGPAFPDEPLSRLIYLAHYSKLSLFEDIRRQFDLSRIEGRVLMTLKPHAATDRNRLAAATYSDAKSLDDVLQRLRAIGYVEQSRPDVWSLTSLGQDVAHRIARHMHAIDRSLVDGMTDAQIEDFRSYLEIYIRNSSAASERMAAIGR